MADETDNTIIDSKDDSGSDGSESKSQPKGKSKLIMFGGIGVGAVVIGVALTIFVLKPMMSSSEDGAGETDEIAQVDQGNKDDSKSEHKAKPKKKKKGGAHEETGIFTIKDIVVNPAGTGGSRFLSVSFAFELESAELGARFEERAPIIRDALITILSSRTVAQLTDPKQKEIVRYQIKKRVAQLMKTEELAGVYYTDFVLQ